MTVIFSILNVIGYILTVILCILTEMCRLMTVILTSVTVIPPIYGCDISPISRYHITYNLFIISRAPRSLLLIAVMNVYTVTLLIHNLSDKSIPEACLHSFNIVSTISGTSVQGA